jgi:hypothetical protein
MEIKTVGDFRRITKGLSDDFNIEIRVRTELPMEKVVESGYPWPYQTEYRSLEFDDIGYSDKDLCLAVEIKGL